MSDTKSLQRPSPDVLRRSFAPDQVPTASLLAGHPAVRLMDESDLSGMEVTEDTTEYLANKTQIKALDLNWTRFPSRASKHFGRTRWLESLSLTGTTNIGSDLERTDSQKG